MGGHCLWARTQGLECQTTYKNTAPKTRYLHCEKNLNCTHHLKGTGPVWKSPGIDGEHVRRSSLDHAQAGGTAMEVGVELTDYSVPKSIDTGLAAASLLCCDGESPVVDCVGAGGFQDRGVVEDFEEDWNFLTAGAIHAVSHQCLPTVLSSTIYAC